MSKTGAGLAKWANDIVAAKTHVYWWGTYCNKCTASLLAGKKRQYPDSYKDKNQATYEKHIKQGKIATDCVGLIKGYYWEKNGVISYRRGGLPDKGSNGMYRATTIKGSIATLPEIPGVLVWTSSKGHVGVYVGGGYVVEARGFSYGVQRNKLTARTFKHWGLCPYVEYTAAEIEQAKAAAAASATTGSATQQTDTPTIRKGSKGDKVREMQTLLVKAGCTLPRFGADGNCGDETVEALKAFQTVNSLTPDGVCGALTWAKLKATTGSTTQKPTESKPATTNRPTIRKGSKGDAVREMQTKLVKAGCALPRYGIDGNCGAETVEALKAFQTANSLTPDGICGPLTWAKLDKV